MERSRYMTIEEIVALPELSSLNISEDGEKLAFVKTIADWGENKYKNYVWIYEKGNSRAYPLTLEKDESTHPLWAPDSKSIAYLRDVEGADQVFIKHVEGYGGFQITNIKEGINSFKWSPDGKGIYFIKNLPEEESLKKRREIYGEFKFADREYQQNLLCYIDMEEILEDILKSNKVPEDLKASSLQNRKEIEIVGDGSYYIQEFDISSQGDKIAFSVTPTPFMEDKYNKDIFLFDVNTNSLNKLPIDGVIMRKTIFSPDGKKICYTRTIREKSYYEYNKKDIILEIYNLETGETSRLLQDFDISINPISWTNKGILINWKNKMNYLIGLLSEDGTLEILDDKENCVIMQPAATKGGDHLAFIKATPSQFFEIYFNGTKVTNENAIYKGKIKGKKETVSWRNCNGLDLEGTISLPQDYNSSKKYPLVVVVGGPLLMPTIDKWFPIEQFVEKGFIVFEPNKRGYWGYGTEFSKGDYKKLGIAYYEDVISGVDMLIDKDMIDKDNIGIMGFSEGGYTSVFCSLYSDRFKAVSSMAGSNDWRTFYISSSIHWYSKQLLGDTPWNDNEVYKKTSNMTYLKSAKSPTLILHKKEEPVEPLINAYELYRGLRDMNVDTELVIFEGTNHYSGEPGQDRAIMKLNLKWFSHYLLGESLDGLRDLV